MERILITICARAGSKRLPGKNTKIFHGKPLIQWTLEQALEFKNQLPNDIVDIAISTDIQKLNFTELFKEIYMIERPENLAGSSVPKIDVIKDIYYYMKVKEKYDYIIDLDVTSPLRKKDDIFNAYCKRKYIHSTLFSVCKSRRIPCFNQIVHLDGIIKTVTNWEDYYGNCISEFFDMNASIYIYNPQWLEFTYSKTPVQKDSNLYPMEDWQNFDIDNQNDWDIVEFLFGVNVLGYSHVFFNGSKLIQCGEQK